MKLKQNISILFTNSFRILERIIKLLYRIEVSSELKAYFTLLQTRIRNHGFIQTVKEFKLMRLHITRYLAGQPLRRNAALIGLDREGWPKRMLFLKKYSESRNGKRFILTLLSFTRILTFDTTGLDPVGSYDSVTAPYTGTKISNLTIPKSFIKEFVSRNGLLPIDLGFTTKDIYFSNKSSLNGPATLTAYDSASLLTTEQITYLKGITDHRGAKYIDNFLKYKESELPEKKVDLNMYRTTCSGKLTAIADAEMKVRVIAIFDYLSQVFLKKIHSGLMRNLRKIPTDRTFTQDPKLQRLDFNHSF